MKFSYQPYGAQLILTMQTKRPRTLARIVNTFANYGMFQNVPEEYKEGEHTKVILAATQKKVHSALKALAEVRLIAAQAKLPRDKRLKGKAFDAKVGAFKEAMWGKFTREDLNTLEDEVKSLDDLRDYESEDIAPEIRARGRRLIRELHVRPSRIDAAKNQKTLS